jgi:hypothetical protein
MDRKPFVRFGAAAGALVVCMKRIEAPRGRYILAPPRCVRRKQGGGDMTRLDEMVAEWRQMRDSLNRQLELLQSGSDRYADEKITTERTITNVQARRDEFDALIRDFGREPDASRA